MSHVSQYLYIYPTIFFCFWANLQTLVSTKKIVTVRYMYIFIGHTTFIPVLVHVHVYQCINVVHFYILPVISSIDDISSVDVRAFSQTSQTTTNDYATGISNRLVALERRLKALEHVRTTSVVKSILTLIHSLSLSLPLP